MINYYFVGYGLRFSIEHGTVHNVAGKHGIQVIMENGSRYLIGTQKPKELQEFLQKMHLNSYS